jgi:hypothetical protein
VGKRTEHRNGGEEEEEEQQPQHGSKDRNLNGHLPRAIRDWRRRRKRANIINK